MSNKIKTIKYNKVSSGRFQMTLLFFATNNDDRNTLYYKKDPWTTCRSLQVYKEKDQNGGWDKWVNQAYFDRVGLSATGFYATPDLGYE